MTENEIFDFITSATLGEVLKRYPLTADFFANMRLGTDQPQATLGEMLRDAEETLFEEFGTTKSEIPMMLAAFLLQFSGDAVKTGEVDFLTIVGGQDKSGIPEEIEIKICRGETAAIVGPTGSGKSRLLADIECLAQRDTPTGRLVLINGKELTDAQRFEMDGKLVAQLSQNMNFIMDLTVRDFLEMHARSRFSRDVECTIRLCLECANDLAGERFLDTTKVTQLSGGQSRALMIADTAFMSSSPLVLIDEIENAGIDRKKAIKVLTKKDKIVLIATHDPLLALSADQRIVIKNGGIFRVIKTAPAEKEILVHIERMDNFNQKLRSRLRTGETITDENQADTLFENLKGS